MAGATGGLDLDPKLSTGTLGAPSLGLAFVALAKYYFWTEIDAMFFKWPVTLALFLFSNCAMAASFLSTTKSFEFGVGSSIEDFSYNEQLTAPSKSSESAIFPTLALEGSVFASDGMSFLKLKVEMANGVASDYGGSDLTTGAPVSATNTLSFHNYELDVSLALGDHVSVYVGYGYRVWNRFLSGNPGYNEIYSWFYTPIGISVWASRDVLFDYGFDFSVRPTTNGTIQVISSQTFSGGQDTTMTLGPKTGYRIESPLVWHWPTWSLSATPYYEHSEIGMSPTGINATLNPTGSNGIYEPSSKTDRYGIEFLVKYAL